MTKLQTSNTTHDCVISARWVVPVVPHNTVLEHHSVVIQRGRIGAVTPTHTLSQEHQALPRIHLPEHLLTAGLINTHGHAAMTLLRGYADDLELMDWLNHHIWPVENRVVNEAFVYDGTSLAIAEMIAGGTTTATDTYFFPDQVARAYLDQHMRAQVCMPVVQFPNAWASTEAQHIDKALSFDDDMKDKPLIRTAFAPHAPYTVTDQAFSSVLGHAQRRGIPIHLHLHEAASELTDGRPLERMEALGLLTHHLQAVHMTQLSSREIERLAAARVHVVHCPESNMKLASGICPVAALKAAGVNVALGTDGAASNNNLDMLEEARSAALLAKVSTQDSTALTAAEALDMATINGARLLGLADETGSIEPGKAADLMAVDFSGFGTRPVYHPISHLIYVASASHVSHTWVAGECLYQDRQYTRLDVQSLQGRVENWRQHIEQDR